MVINILMKYNNWIIKYGKLGEMLFEIKGNINQISKNKNSNIYDPTICIIFIYV